MSIKRHVNNYDITNMMTKRKVGVGEGLGGLPDGSGQSHNIVHQADLGRVCHRV